MPEAFPQAISEASDRRLRVVAHQAVRSAALLVLLCSGAGAAQEVVLEPIGLVVPESSALEAPASSQVDLLVDFAVVMQIAGDVSVVVLGNAEIADVSVVATGTIVLTGKTVGATNVLILGTDGSVTSELQVRVADNTQGTVTVRRALRASTYSCTAWSCRYSGDEPELVTVAASD